MKLRVGCCHLDKRKSLGCHLGKAFGGLASAGPHAIRLRTICAARKETTPETREESQQTVLWPESEGDGVESAPQPAAVRQPPGRAPARHPARLSRRQQQLESDLWGLPPQQDLRGQEGHLHQQEEEQQEQQAELKAQLDPHALQGDGRHRHRRPVSADQDPAAASLRGDNGSNSKGGGGGGAGGAGGNAAADAGYAQQQEHVSSAAPAERPAQTSPPRSSSHSTNIRAPAGKVDPAAAEAGAARPTASQGAQPPAQAQEHEQQQQRRQEQQQQEGAATASGGRRLRLRRGLAAAAAPTRVSVRLPLSQRPQPWVVKAILEGRQREQEEEQQGQQRRQAGAEGQGKEAAKGRGTGKPGAQAGATVAAPREGKAGAPAEKRAGKQTSAPASGATGAHGQTKAPSKEDAKQGQQRKKGKDSKKKGAKAQDAQPSRPKWTGPGVVAVHPDGCTLWAHRRRDSTDMAEAVLLVLQQQVAVLQEQQLLQQQQRGVGRGVGAGAGEGEGGASDGPPPTCHVLAVGPQQNYNVMRALSYNQEILRLMAHNGMSLAGAAASPARLASMPTGPVHSRAGGSPGGAGAAASAGPSPSAMPMLLCAVTGVSLPATRSFYQETLRAGGTLDPVVGSSVVYGTAGVVPEVGTSPGYTPPGTGAPAGAGVRAAAAASAAAGTAAQRRGQQRAESRLDSAVKHPAPRHAVADGDGGGAGVGEAHDLDPEAEAMAPGLPGWPSQASVLQPRVLYTVMGPLALDLPAWAAAAAAAGLQPLAVSEGCTAEQVRRLAEMAAARVQRRGHCCLQAMGYLAASRAAEVLRVAAALLAEAGCGCVLVPHTTAVPLPQWTKRSQDVDGMQGAVGQQQQGTGAAGVKAAGGKGKMGKGGGAGGFIGAVREAVGQASGELGAALAASAPSLVGRGSQLELHLLACEWGAEGQPLLRAPGGTQAGAQAAGPAATGAAAALQSVLQGQQDEGQGEQAVKSGTSGNRGSSGGAGSSEMERVAVTVPWPEASAVEGEFEVQGAPDGGLAAAVKRACCSLPVGRWLRVRCVGLGAVARVPVLLRRPGRWYVDADGVRQGHATPWVAWQVRSVPDEGAAAGTPGKGKRGRRQPLAVVIEVLRVPSRAMDSHLARLTSPLPRVVLGLGLEGPSSINANTLSHTQTLSLSHSPQPQPQPHARGPRNKPAHALLPKLDQQELQLQHHHVGLPHRAGSHAAAVAATAAAAAGAGAMPLPRGPQHQGRASAGGDLSQQVSEAAAAITEQLARQGIARLEAWGSQGRAATVLALSCVSEVLLEAEGLGVVAAVEGTRQWMHLRQGLAGEQGQDEGAAEVDVDDDPAGPTEALRLVVVLVRAGQGGRGAPASRRAALQGPWHRA